jgi:hypothetical protein
MLLARLSYCLFLCESVKSFLFKTRFLVFKKAL